MDKNINILILLLFLPMVVGFEYNIKTIKNCEGAINVYDRTTYDGVYSIKNCDWKNNMWVCPCSPVSRPLTLIYENEKEEIYDFVIEYYVGDNNNEDNKRTYSYEGLTVSGVKERKTLPLLDPDNKTLLIVGFFVLGIIILGVVWFIFKQIYDKEDIEETVEKKEELIIEDEDIIDILDKYG